MTSHVSRVLMRIGVRSSHFLVVVGCVLLLWVGYRWSKNRPGAEVQRPESHRRKAVLSPVALTLELRCEAPKFARLRQRQLLVRQHRRLASHHGPNARFQRARGFENLTVDVLNRSGSKPLPTQVRVRSNSSCCGSNRISSNSE